MATLRVVHLGQELAKLDLDPAREYIVGRGSKCDVILPSEPGLSRQHLRIAFDGQTWQVELISRYGGLLYNGDPVEKLALTGTTAFALPPFEFTYSDAVDNPAAETPALDTPAGEIPVPEVFEMPQAEAETAEPAIDSKSVSQAIELQDQMPTPDPIANLDATVVGKVSIHPYLKIRNLKTKTDETLKLEGQSWVLGRHPDCEIVINDAAISRRHFQIHRSPDGYTITDLGSSNGTTVNGDKIDEGGHPIGSGDVVTIRHIEIIFEIRDSDFDQRAEALPELEYLPAVAGDPGMGAAPVVRLPNSQVSAGAGGFFQNKVRIVLIALVGVLIYGLMSNDEQRPAPAQGDQQDLNSQSPAKPVELSDEQKSLARDTFKLANNYFMQQKYEFCLSQIEKLHNIVPYYENSKEIENLCRQGIELQQINEDRERKLQEQQAVENEIRSIVSRCRQILTKNTTGAEMQVCVQRAFELDPQNPDIVELLETVRLQESQINEEAEKARRFAQRKQEGQTIYSRAMGLFRSGNFKAARKELERFVQGRYPGLNQQEDEAARTIASIDEKFRAKINDLLNACRGAFDRNEYKKAIDACNEVLKEERNNKDARDIKAKALSTLKRDMQSLYQDAVLEEGLGNIEAAKQKWQKIKDTSVPGEDYYDKALKKLQRYGAG